MEKKFLTELKVGDKIYLLDDKKVSENGVEELTADSGIFELNTSLIPLITRRTFRIVSIVNPPFIRKIFQMTIDT